MKKLIICLFGLFLLVPYSGLATSIVDVEKEIEKANQQNIPYYKKNSLVILKSQEKEMVIEKKVDDTSLLQEKEQDFKESLANEMIEMLNRNLAEANTSGEVNAVLSEVIQYKKEKEEAFADTKGEYVNEKVEKETRNVMMVSAQYKTIRDSLFSQKHHRFYYYDVDTNEFISDEEARGVTLVEQFEEDSSKHIIEENIFLNSFYVVLLLMIMCLFPFILGRLK